jgi:hypothetical protein
VTVTDTTATTVTISWASVATATYYTVYETRSGYSQVSLGTTTALSYKTSILRGATGYSFQVSASNVSGEGTKSNSVSVTSATP